jgi:hypothetical protein
LDEDIENRQLGYSEKLENIEKKLEYSRKKTYDEKLRIQQEFEEQVVVSIVLALCRMVMFL